MALQLPNEPRRGQPIEAGLIAQLIRYLRSITPRGGPGVRVTTMPNGTTISASIRSVAAEETVEENHPFKIINATTEEDGAQVSVVFGQVNSLTPTIGGDPLDADPAPVLAVVSGVVYLHVTVEAEEGAITAAAIENAAELPDNTATEGYLTLATVVVEDDRVTAINQAVTHSLQHRRCGVNDHHFWGL